MGHKDQISAIYFNENRKIIVTGDISLNPSIILWDAESQL